MVPGSYAVPVWLMTTGGGWAVPKCTSCDVALLPAVQLKSAFLSTPVAPVAGFGLLAWPGAGEVVPNTWILSSQQLSVSLLNCVLKRTAKLAWLLAPAGQLILRLNHVFCDRLAAVTC